MKQHIFNASQCAFLHILSRLSQQQCCCAWLRTPWNFCWHHSPFLARRKHMNSNVWERTLCRRVILKCIQQANCCLWCCLCQMAALNNRQEQQSTLATTMVWSCVTEAVVTAKPPNLARLCKAEKLSPGFSNFLKSWFVSLSLGRIFCGMKGMFPERGKLSADMKEKSNFPKRLTKRKNREYKH